MKNFLKRTWAKVDLDAIENNFWEIKKALNEGTKIMCVLKADAYGHGAEALAHLYEELGADWFAVSNIEEAIQLRGDGITTPILILGYTPANEAVKLSENNISQAVFSKKYAMDLSNEAKSKNVKVNVHIKLDTGMSRLGFLFQDENRDKSALDEIESVSKLPNLNLEGIFTHFAVSDEPGFGEEKTAEQYRLFKFAVDKLEERKVHIPLKHCSNSAGILNYKNMNFDMVRAGIILYGLYPSNFRKTELNLVPAMTLKSVISLIKKVPAGTKISYGCTYTTKHDTKIATVPIGYADGYLRLFSGKAYIMVDGKRAAVIGRICMDQMMVDVTDVENVSENSEVIIFGGEKENTVTLDELAKIANTINYELLCILSKRVPRIYVRKNQLVDQLNYICPDKNDNE